MGFFQQEKLSTVAKDKVLKEDCQLFSKSFISCQNRECDGGRLHVCQKSQLAAILEGKVTLPDAEPMTDVIIIDGSAFVNALTPRASKTFAEYAEMEFIPKVYACAKRYHKTDIVFDRYDCQICLKRFRYPKNRIRRTIDNTKEPKYMTQMAAILKNGRHFGFLRG